VRDEAARFEDFLAFHAPALEADEVRHNLILGLLLAGAPVDGVRLWTLGGPGACALQFPSRNIVLGALDRGQCQQLADEVRALDIPGVVGGDQTAAWFVDHARTLGLAFLSPVPQQIHALRTPPRYPGAAGHARQASPADAELFAGWAWAFCDEAVPHDPKPARTQLNQGVTDGRHFFWVADGQPVSMAGVARRTPQTAAISLVYTPPTLRGRGYAGSVTAAVADHIMNGEKRTPCLYTDLRNPASNRCYAKIGFVPVCSSYHYARQPMGGAYSALAGSSDHL
jgi:RimJ/RimL family protein N-acetyltransferase